MTVELGNLAPDFSLPATWGEKLSAENKNDGERKYDEFEKRLAQFPPIAVPTITLERDANGAPHPEPAAYAKKFTGKYEHRLIEGGIGHNLPAGSAEGIRRCPH